MLDTDLAHFEYWGYLRIPQALPAALVARVREAVWDEWGKLHGMKRDDPATWPASWVGINKDRVDRVARVAIGPPLQEAVDRLLGAGRWRPLRTLGGLLLTLPQGPPEAWTVPSSGWHVDNAPRCYMAEVDELMLFTFYSSVKPRGGGTLILSGSPSLLEQYFASHSGAAEPDPNALMDRLAQWHPRLAELLGRKTVKPHLGEDWLNAGVEIHGTTVRIVELTGEPGDAFLCHPSMLHVGSQNCAAEPRIMRRTNFRRSRKAPETEPESKWANGESSPDAVGAAI